MASKRFHFVEDYRELVRDLIARYPLAEAMSRAVGGNFEALGAIEKQLLIRYGLEPQHTLVDVGCGSGRLAKQLVGYLSAGRVLGTDVVPELLDYAQNGCPPQWQFRLVEGTRIPFGNNEADVAAFFSVFSHLLHDESYCYLVEARRVVKPGGTIVFSFLEFEQNWDIFKGDWQALLDGRSRVHLNSFIGRDAIEVWARHLGMAIVDIRSGTDAFIELPAPVVGDDGARTEGSVAFGQSICVLRNDKALRARTRPSWSTNAGYTIDYPGG
jgi:ubiquinone/menaquinone biosynthesis C-methylase UbiE